MYFAISFQLFQLTSPMLIHQILRFKQENPSLFAWEIRDILLSHRICDESSCPSVSSINRILRHTAESVHSVSLPWTATTVASWQARGIHVSTHPYRSHMHHHQQPSLHVQHPVVRVPSTVPTIGQLPDLLTSHKNDQILQGSNRCNSSLLPATPDQTIRTAHLKSNQTAIMQPAAARLDANATNNGGTFYDERRASVLFNATVVKEENSSIRGQKHNGGPPDTDNRNDVEQKQFTNFTIDRILKEQIGPSKTE